MTSRALSLVLLSCILSAATPHHKSKHAVVKAKPQSAHTTINSSWNGGTGNWSTSADWTPNASYPNNGGGKTYDVTIGTGSDDVSLDTNVTISSLTLGDGGGTSILQNLAGSAESLNDRGALTINGGGQLKFNNGSTLAAGSGMTNAGIFSLSNGSTATVTGNVTNNGGSIYIDALNIGGNSGSGGSVLNVDGSLANSGGGSIYVGNGDSAPSTLNVSGTLSNAMGSSINVTSGDSAATAALLNVSRAAPSTLTGNYSVASSGGTAAVEFGSGSITAIGNSTSEGLVQLYGTNAYIEIGATNSNSALTNLRSIGSGSGLYLSNGASLTTATALTNNGEVSVSGGQFGAGTSLTIGGALSNSEFLLVNGGLGTSATLNVEGTFTNTNTTPSVTGGLDGNAFLNVTGALINSGNLSFQGGYAGAATLSTAAPVTISSAGSIVLNGSTYTGTGAAVWEIAGPTLSNSGTIVLNGGVADASLEIGANVTTSGSGAIELSNATTNLITGTSSNFTLTNGSTIEGSGTISNLGIVNQGTISANQSTPLLILPSNLGLDNKGTLSVSAGDTMQIGTSAGGALTNLSGTTLTGGTYSVGGTMQFGASTAGIVTDAANITLTGAGAQMINFGGSSLLTNLAAIASGGNFTLGKDWGTFTTTGSFTNNGTLSVGAGDKFIVDLSDSLTNFSGATLTGGTYKITGTLQFAGANIVTNDANITLTGAGSKIDGSGQTNGLANLTTNNGSFSLGTGRSFTTAGNFTNNGLLSVASGDTFQVNGNLTNFSGATLASGNYSVSGTLQFNGANIVTNAAAITLGSATALIQNQSAANAMLGFTTNTGSFTLSGNASLITNGGSFTNSGTVTVNSGSTFTIGASSSNYLQTAGTTTVNGTLAGASTGSLELNGGSLYGTGSLDYGVSDSATITPGDSSTSTGKLQVNGAYTQNANGALDVTIGGTIAGTKYDQLNVSGTASLNGTLNISLASGFTPAVGSTFDIVNASSITGTFSTVNGVAINGSEHFTVTTVNGDEIVLTVVSGAAVSNAVSLAAARHAGQRHGRWGLGIAPPRAAWPGPAPLAPIAALIATPAGSVSMPRTPMSPVTGLPVSHAFHAMDELGAPVAQAGAGAISSAGLPGASPVSALAYNSMAAMNHMRFECGVDLGALRQAGGKRLLRALWAAPDSPDALNIGYMTMTAAH